MPKYTRKSLFFAGMASAVACAATLMEQPEEHLAELPVRHRAHWTELLRSLRSLADALADHALKETN